MVYICYNKEEESLYFIRTGKLINSKVPKAMTIMLVEFQDLFLNELPHEIQVMQPERGGELIFKTYPNQTTQQSNLMP